MALGVYFHPQGMTKAQYDQIIKKLDESGAGKPAGRQFHACFGEDGSLMVFDVWDDQTSFEAFGQKLMPIVGEVGVQLPEPAVMPVHNLIA